VVDDEILTSSDDLGEPEDIEMVGLGVESTAQATAQSQL